VSRSAFAIALLTVALSVSSAVAKDLPLRFVTADGAWDCMDAGGAAVGTIVVAEKTYAFLKPDGILAGYGKLHLVGAEQYDLPHYVILDGYLKEELGFSGTTMRGPRDDYENYSKGIFLVLIKPDFTDADCTRRLAPDA
jgi:hypothetical protein